MKYKNKDIEYRDKKKQVHDAVVKLLDEYVPFDGEKIDKKDVKGLDWKKIGTIMYMITKEDAMNVHNDQFDIDESVNKNNNWQQFATIRGDVVTGIYISPDKKKEFKKYAEEAGYEKDNIGKLIKFLNKFQ